MVKYLMRVLNLPFILEIQALIYYFLIYLNLMNVLVIKVCHYYPKEKKYCTQY